MKEEFTYHLATYIRGCLKRQDHHREHFYQDLFSKISFVIKDKNKNSFLQKDQKIPSNNRVYYIKQTLNPKHETRKRKVPLLMLKYYHFGIIPKKDLRTRSSGPDFEGKTLIVPMTYQLAKSYLNCQMPLVYG